MVSCGKTPEAFSGNVFPQRANHNNTIGEKRENHKACCRSTGISRSINWRSIKATRMMRERPHMASLRPRGERLSLTVCFHSPQYGCPLGLLLAPLHRSPPLPLHPPPPPPPAHPLTPPTRRATPRRPHRQSLGSHEGKHPAIARLFYCRSCVLQGAKVYRMFALFPGRPRPAVIHRRLLLQGMLRMRRMLTERESLLFPVSPNDNRRLRAWRRAG